MLGAMVAAAMLVGAAMSLPMQVSVPHREKECLFEFAQEEYVQ